MPVTKRGFYNYVMKAGALADAVKKTVVKGEELDKDVKKALNDFITAENAIKDLQEILDEEMQKYDN